LKTLRIRTSVITSSAIAGRAIQAPQPRRHYQNAANPASRRQQTRERGKAAGRTRGMDLVESQPAAAVIAFAGGGAAKTVRGLDTEAPTGVLFGTRSTSAIVAAVAPFEGHALRIAATACGSAAAL